MVPNKSTMVEDDDDLAGLEDDYDTRSDAFALDGVLSRRGTTTTLGDGERKLLADSQSQVSALQEKVEKLEELVRSKDEELSNNQDEEKTPVCYSIEISAIRVTYACRSAMNDRSGTNSNASWRVK